MSELSSPPITLAVLGLRPKQVSTRCINGDCQLEKSDKSIYTDILFILSKATEGDHLMYSLLPFFQLKG
jgi:hypothetical protein